MPRTGRPKAHFCDAHGPACVKCHKAKYQRDYYRRNKERLAGQNHENYRRRKASGWVDPYDYRSAYLRRTYGITKKMYDEMLAAQGGVCRICREPSNRTMHIDHDHRTKAIRGLLCGDCNKGLGHFRDDPRRLELAAAYVRLHHLPVA